jgi:ribosome maturation factor RimP
VIRSETAVAEDVRRLAEGVAAALRLEIVDVVFHRAGKGGFLRVDIESPGTPGVTLGDCQSLSEGLDRALDESGLFEERYVLEVSSPGIDRPIVTDDDVRRNVGRRVQVETLEPVGGTRSVHGVLLGLDGDSLRLRLQDGAELAIPRSLVAKAQQEMDIRAQPKRPAGPRRRHRRGIV